MTLSRRTVPPMAAQAKAVQDAGPGRIAPALRRRREGGPTPMPRGRGFPRATIAVLAALLAGSSPAPAQSGPPRAHHAPRTIVRAKSAAALPVARAAGKRSRSAAPVRKASRVQPGRAVPSPPVRLVNSAWDGPALPPDIAAAVGSAARATGVDPTLLLAIAWRESRFDPAARNRMSSAHGLLQFTRDTWLTLVKEFGDARYADAIRRDPSGGLEVQGRGMLKTILALRDDPRLSALLAAESIRRESTVLAHALGRNPGPTDLYLVHALGPSGAIRFLTALARHPAASSLDVAGAQALRNAGLLAPGDRSLSVAQTYRAIRTMLDSQRARMEPMLAAEAAEAPPEGAIEVAQAP